MRCYYVLLSTRCAVREVVRKAEISVIVERVRDALSQNYNEPDEDEATQRSMVGLPEIHEAVSVLVSNQLTEADKPEATTTVHSLVNQLIGWTGSAAGPSTGTVIGGWPSAAGPTEHPPHASMDPLGGRPARDGARPEGLLLEPEVELEATPASNRNAALSHGAIHGMPVCLKCQTAELPRCTCSGAGLALMEPEASSLRAKFAEGSRKAKLSTLAQSVAQSRLAQLQQAPKPRVFSFELPATAADARAAGGPKHAPKSGFDPLGHL